MGLDTTHNCWHGSYPAFFRFRIRLGEAVGIDVMRMQHYGGYLPWPPKDLEPLVILLDHSDCDGEIAKEDCAPLAARLEVLLANDCFADDTIRKQAQQWASGLRDAAKKHQKVRFG